MDPLRRALLKHAMRCSGLYYYGDDEDLEAELRKHYPHLLKQAVGYESVVSKFLSSKFLKEAE